MIVLIGFMGAGKTTVGGLIADKTGLPFVDVDSMIEARAGAGVQEIFAAHGEAHFRALERDAVDAVLEGPDAVVALGGGALGDPATCVALEWHDVVHLEVSYGEAMRRIGRDPGRPMLAIEDPRALFEGRRSAYERVARHSVVTDDRSPEEVAGMVLATLGLSGDEQRGPVDVRLGSRSYKVHVGPGAARELGSSFEAPHATKAFVVTHPGLTESAGTTVGSLADRGLEVTVLTVDEGEASKDLVVAGRLLEQLAEAGATRHDVVVSFGGGVVSDLAGFVASVYHRGMRVVHVPTSLLAQVDASVGGKTAVNLESGKNLVGTIHQPLVVVCDTSLLKTLPDAELRAGMAEVIKMALITGQRAVDAVIEAMPAALARDEDALTEIVRDAVVAKAAVVAADERDDGLREILNYGHTFGHAVEHVTRVRHGEAVSIGMMAAGHLAVSLGMLGEGVVDLQRNMIEMAGLPVAASFDLGAVRSALRRDKKNRDEVRFVLLSDVGAPKRGVSAPEDLVARALSRVSS